MRVIRRLARFVADHPVRFGAIVISIFALDILGLLWAIVRLGDGATNREIVAITAFSLGALLLPGALLAGVAHAYAAKKPSDVPDVLAHLKWCCTTANNKLNVKDLTLGNESMPPYINGLPMFTVGWVSTVGIRSKANGTLHIPRDTYVTTAWSEENPLAVFFDKRSNLWAVLLWEGDQTPLDNVSHRREEYITLKTFDLNFLGKFDLAA